MIVVITGPTGVGKTKMSISLAHYLDGEIINADSTQVYKGLDIATAKVTNDEMEDIKHHLIDIKNIDEDYTVYDYQKDCRKKIEEIKKKNKVPIIVGGTGLYIKAALYDYNFVGNSNNQYEDISLDDLYKKLLKIDPNTDIHPNNRKRIVRALNYYNDTNKPYSLKEKNSKLIYDDVIFIGLTTNRENLYNIINNRVDKMIDNGMLEEVKKIYDLNIRSKAIMTPIGYKELFEYFDGNIKYEEAINLIKQRSRRYAKRQYTWFNHQMDIKWFEVDYGNFNNTINDVIKYINN